ncbi:Hpt domain-containing protein [Brevundimonas sp.]|uniref:Hpt domain-containing protein n=1 Tax=Brevundimonas sp. TaxID=1871086 RepID=UPI003D0B8F31
MSDDPLAALRAEFCVRAVEDRAALAQALAVGDLDRVERVAHGLAGSAGLFEFTDIGAAALAVDDGFASGRGLDAAAADKLIAALDALP